MKHGPFFQIFLFVNILKVITDSQEIVKIVERGPLFGTRHPVSASSIMHYIILAQYQSQEVDIIHRPCSRFTGLWWGIVILCSFFECRFV